MTMMDGKSYPLLADGPWAWKLAGTSVTFKIKKAAHWSDGTPVTADDVAYTWATHVKYKDGVGSANTPYIANITAVDPQTVQVTAVLGADGKPVNPLVVTQYLDANYVIQDAWTKTLEARAGGDATKLLADTAEDVVYSGPYHKFFADDTKVVLIRDDKYWGAGCLHVGQAAHSKVPGARHLQGQCFRYDRSAGRRSGCQPAVQLQRSGPVAQAEPAHLHLLAGCPV